MRQDNRNNGIEEYECDICDVIITLYNSGQALAIILSNYSHLSCHTIIAGELYTTALISCLYATYRCYKAQELQRLLNGIPEEELNKKIAEILKQLTESPENADSKLNSIMLATIPIIRNPEIFENPQFLQLLKNNFPEITNPESFKETLKEIYLSFVNLEEEEQRFGLIQRLKESIPQTPPPQHTMSDSSSDSEPEIDFRRRFVNFCQGISELLNRGRDPSDSESDRLSSSDGFRGVESASYEQLSEQQRSILL